MKIEIVLYTPVKMPTFYKKAIAEYEKRLSRYGKISLRTIKKEKDWIKCLEQAESGYYLVAGESVSSEELSDRIALWEGERMKEVTFYVNDSYEDFIRSYENLKAFSISDFTLSGPMTAMILYEQIYRGYRIMHHHPYHK